MNDLNNRSCREYRNDLLHGHNLIDPADGATVSDQTTIVSTQEIQESIMTLNKTAELATVKTAIDVSRLEARRNDIGSVDLEISGKLLCSELPDRLLISLWCQNNELAFDELYRRYRPRLISLARSMHVPKNDVEDLVDDVFLKFIVKRTQYTPERGLLFPYLASILRRTNVDNARKKRLRYEHGALIDEMPSNESEAVDMQRLAFECFEGLTVKQKQLLELTQQRDLDLAGIAKRMGCTVDAVKQKKRRLIRAVRQFFDKQSQHRNGT